MESKIIKIKDQNGQLRDAEIVLAFSKEDKKFVIYTFNEEDENGMLILYSSIIIEEDNKIILEKISPDDWTMVKQVMNKIVKEWKEQ